MEALLDFDILPLFVIDSSGLCARYLSVRFEGSIVEENITSSGIDTHKNFLEALTKGCLIKKRKFNLNKVIN